MKNVLFGMCRFGIYPIVFGGTSVLQVYLLHGGWAYWPITLLFAASGIALVAIAEQFFPYHTQWLEDHDDYRVDCLHALTSLSLMFGAAEVVAAMRAAIMFGTLWPESLPLWSQVLLVGLIIDFGLWLMHWLSHKNPVLWRLHALHHSSERLYWLNGERRHPFSAVILGVPGIAVVALLGAPTQVIGTWMAIIAVHLAFQHANLDYSLGPFKHLLAVAQVHRWHHKREYEDAQVNFGEFWMIWDHVFGTYHNPNTHLASSDVGMKKYMPTRYLKQLSWPFTHHSSDD